MKLVSKSNFSKKRSRNFFIFVSQCYTECSISIYGVNYESNHFSLTVFLAGILSFFSPCVFPLLPVYIGILLGSDQEKAIQLFGKKFAGMAC